ncbi:MAG TPA: galactose-1-phosphate uridylyltransferase [Pirellulales bacterium]|nr:galactose-1-phosphate uridylyltransferase [Pirellulales bacterium]
MSQLRFDVATTDWVIFAPSRALRPHRAPSPPPAPAAPEAPCPFCPGNEAFTPPEIYAARGPGQYSASNWRVRVVPNKFPALRIEEDTRRIEEKPVFSYMGGCGAHEVIVESPEHNVFLGQQPVDQIELVLRTVQLRHQDLMRDHRFQTIIAFKNHGAAAGTSLGHPHWQVIAMPVVPRVLRQKLTVAEEYFDRTGDCLYCVKLQAELESGKRILAQNDDYVALLPYASHVPFETWIMPLRRQATFAGVDPGLLKPLASLLRSILLKLYTGLDNPSFNLTIDSVSRGDESKEYFMWHMRILPRLTTQAGFEMGSGMSINTVLPEDAKNFLCEVETVENHARLHGGETAAPAGTGVQQVVLAGGSSQA